MDTGEQGPEFLLNILSIFTLCINLRYIILFRFPKRM